MSIKKTLKSICAGLITAGVLLTLSGCYWSSGIGPCAGYPCGKYACASSCGYYGCPCVVYKKVIVKK